MAGIDELEMQTDVDELIESLTRSLEDGDWKVREAAAEALGKISNPRVVEPLIKCSMTKMIMCVMLRQCAW